MYAMRPIQFSIYKNSPTQIYITQKMLRSRAEEKGKWT